MKHCLIIALLLTGCGVDVESSTGGIFVDDSLVESLRADYDDVQACTGMDGDDFNYLQIVLMSLPFNCPHYPDGCAGLYEAYNIIRIGTPAVFRHEIIHYLLYVTYWDADASHEGPYWGVCE